jgi:hypothetical protein
MKIRDQCWRSMALSGEHRYLFENSCSIAVGSLIFLWMFSADGRVFWQFWKGYSVQDHNTIEWVLIWLPSGGDFSSSIKFMAKMARLIKSKNFKECQLCWFIFVRFLISLKIINVFQSVQRNIIQSLGKRL